MIIESSPLIGIVVEFNKTKSGGSLSIFEIRIRRIDESFVIPMMVVCNSDDGREKREDGIRGQCIGDRPVIDTNAWKMKSLHSGGIHFECPR